MSQESPFEFSLDADDGFIDVEDFGFESFEEDEDYVEPEAEKFVIPEEDKTPEQLISELFEAMKPYKRVLKSLITFCEERKTVPEIDEEISKLVEYNRSVYTPSNLCVILERNKALDRVDENGEPVTEDGEEAEVVVDEDGNEYMEPKEQRVFYFVATAEALAYVAADDPQARIMERIGDEERFKPIYKIILDHTAQEGGVSMNALDEELFDAKLLRDEKLWPQRFIDKLEACECIEWNTNWCITKIGAEVLETLADVDTTLERVELED